MKAMFEMIGLEIQFKWCACNSLWILVRAPQSEKQVSPIELPLRHKERPFLLLIWRDDQVNIFITLKILDPLVKEFCEFFFSGSYHCVINFFQMWLLKTMKFYNSYGFWGQKFSSLDIVGWRDACPQCLGPQLGRRDVQRLASWRGSLTHIYGLSW